ncbi:AEC family transporter [Oceanobacillus sp. J11TS1]|uniref:AEC family transporter n=1 Tax=Oceanobacillus sp. J11TS1 TaxID=2807191 RepID=UPI001B230CF0|nr:AEC family transporter [Oceanobacillus sp. J11TS1]GIO23505.1 transporter [Oceanobacillus sp. J11TS1]
MDTLFTLAYEIGSLYIIVLIGWIVKRKKLISEDGQRAFTTLLLYVALPCLIISSMHMPFQYEQAYGALIMFVLSIYIMSGTLFLSRFIARRLTISMDRKAVFENVILFGNQGFIGMVIILQLFGQEGVLFASVFNLIYYVLIWTYAIYIMNPEGLPDSKAMFILKNPGFLATMVGFILFIFPIQIPSFIMEPIAIIGQMTVPLSMIMIGMMISAITFSRAVAYMKDALVYIAVLIRLFIYPILFFLPLLFFQIPFEWFMVACLLSATPSPATISMYAQVYGGDMEFSSVVVFFSTLLSVISIPIVYFFFLFFI